MKKELLYTYMLLVMIAIVTVTSTSFGSGSSSSSPNRGRKIVCSTKDNGWEEHWGGHNTCGECLAKHGGCVEICSEVNYSCTAKGKTSSGSEVSAQAIGPDRYDSADEAIRRCQSMGGTDCRASSYSDCEEVKNESSRSTCRRTSALDIDESRKIGASSYLFAKHIAKEPAAVTISEQPENTEREKSPRNPVAWGLRKLKNTPTNDF